MGWLGRAPANHFQRASKQKLLKTLFFHIIAGLGLQFSYANRVLKPRKNRVLQQWFFIEIFEEALKGLIRPN